MNRINACVFWAHTCFKSAESFMTGFQKISGNIARGAKALCCEWLQSEAVGNPLNNSNSEARNKRENSSTGEDAPSDILEYIYIY